MEAKDFLEKNGFNYDEVHNYYYNDKCKVSNRWESYVVAINNSGLMYSQDLNIYWLIGVLTYYGLIDKNYKQ
jgi:hypothetical protein